MFAQQLNDRTLVSISGGDAETFLENILTCPVANLASGEAAFGALLTPQGKILFDFFLSRENGGFIVDISDEIAAEFVKRLTFYRLRAKVDIGVVEDSTIFAAWDVKDGSVPAGAARDTRHPDLGYRLSNRPADAVEGNYDSLRIEIGMPEGGKDYAYGDAYPHEVLMDQTGGVDFKKGCFVGQEVVSRMQHRGSVKKRIVKISAREDLPAPGVEVTANGKPLGFTGTTAGKAGLALLRLDRTARAVKNGETVLAGGVRIEVRIPDWVNFGWPEVAAKNA